MRLSQLPALALLALAACRTDGIIGHSGDSSSIPTDPGSPGIPGLGVNASLQGRRPFPADNAWNTRVDTASVDSNSDALIASIGLTKGLHPDFGANYGGGPFGIPYVVVSGDTPAVSVAFDYADESDPGSYPIPIGAPIEGGSNSNGDRHVLVIDRDHWKLYELYAAYPVASSVNWTAGSGAIFDLSSDALRPAGWTSADAAGLPIFPGLARYDEVVEQGAVLQRCASPCRTRGTRTSPLLATTQARTPAPIARQWACAYDSSRASTSRAFPRALVCFYKRSRPTG
jgi:hypothetical protein